MNVDRQLQEAKARLDLRADHDFENARRRLYGQPSIEQETFDLLRKGVASVYAGFASWVAQVGKGLVDAAEGMQRAAREIER